MANSLRLMIPEINQNIPPFKINAFTRDGVALFDPLAIDHKKDVNIRFAEKNTIDDRGFKIKTEIYEYSIVTVQPVSFIRSVEYYNLIKIIDINYVIGADTGPLSRTEIFSFVREDGSVEQLEDFKIKYYSSTEGITEGVKRRHNVIDKLKSTVVYLLMQTEQPLSVPQAENMAKPITLLLENEISGFIEGNTRAELEQAIASCTGFDWLNNVINGDGQTIRDLMVYTINISEL